MEYLDIYVGDAYQINQFFLILLIVGILASLVLISTMIIFKKLNGKWYHAIIPFYNIYILTKLLNMPSIYFWLSIIPIANVYASIKISIELVKKMNKSNFFVFGIMFLPIIFYPILAFSKVEVNSVVQLEKEVLPEETEPESLKITNEESEINTSLEQTQRLNKVYLETQNMEPPAFENQEVFIKPVEDNLSNLETQNMEPPAFENKDVFIKPIDDNLTNLESKNTESNENQVSSSVEPVFQQSLLDSETQNIEPSVFENKEVFIKPVDDNLTNLENQDIETNEKKLNETKPDAIIDFTSKEEEIEILDF